MKISICCLCGTLFVYALGGCDGVPPTIIEATDNNVFVPNMRASWSLTGPKDTPSEPRSGSGIEFEALTARGSGSQSIDAGQQPVFLRDKTFTPSQALHHDFRYTYYDVSYRWRRFFGDGPVGLEVLVGPAYATLDFKVTSPTQQAADTFSYAGPSAGLGLIWRARPDSSVQARYTVADLFGDNASLAQTRRAEAFLVQALGQNASARAGYTWWSVDATPPAGSEIQVKFNGPSLGLELQF